MRPARTKTRALRAEVLARLTSGDFPDNLLEPRGPGGPPPPPRRMIRPLLGLLARGDPALKERAVTALGILAARLAAENIEDARQIVRRLMWSLNDESGSIGWGAPEAMAEILVLHEGLASEYASILVSYLCPEGNYLEHAPLQRDLLRGIGRLAAARPGLLRDQGAPELLVPYLSSPDAQVRGLAAWCAGFLPCPGARGPLEGLLHDPAEIVLYRGGETARASVASLARRALDACRGLS